MVKWLHVGSTADSRMDGHKIVNAGNPYRRETQVGGLKPHNMYSFMVREETGQNNWGKFSDPVDVIMPEDGKLISTFIKPYYSVLYKHSLKASGKCVIRRFKRVLSDIHSRKLTNLQPITSQQK